MSGIPPSQAANGAAVNFFARISPVKFKRPFRRYDGDNTRPSVKQPMNAAGRLHRRKDKNDENYRPDD